MAKAEKTPALQPLGTMVASDDDKIFADPDYRAGAEAEAAQDHVEMLKRGQALVRRYPENDLAHFWLGVAYANLKFYEDAIAAFKQAIKLKPDYPEAWAGLGLAYRVAGRMDDARDAFQRAEKLKPGISKSW